MNKIPLLLIIFLGSFFLQSANAQNISNEGAEFWTVFPTHDPSGSSLANMVVNITSRFNSEVTVSCGAYRETKFIPANSVVSFFVPRSISYIDPREANDVSFGKGIYIEVTPGKPNVVAYSHVFAGNRSAATLILPYKALGQKYYSMNYTQSYGDGQSKNFLAVVAAENNTKLILHRTDGSTLLLPELNKGDVYEYMPEGKEDLTGVFIEVDAASKCKRFAAFSGSTTIAIGCDNSRDPLFQQLYSINNWGKVYGIIPFFNRRYIIRVLAQEDGTKIFADGSLIATINKGNFYESPISNSPIIISGDKLISVAQYSLTQDCSGVNGGSLPGDPEMVLLNPIEFNIKNITVFSSSNRAILVKYINVFMKTQKTKSFRVNGVIPSATWQVMPSAIDYSYIQLQVYEDGLTLTADDGFNAIAYGFGQTESYAYSAGTSLSANQFLTILNKTTNVENSSACIGQLSDFKMTLPYQVTSIIWKFSDNTPDFPDNNPQPVVSITGSGESLYTYSAPVNKIFDVLGPVRVTADVELAATADECYSNLMELIFDFNVDPLPVAEFKMAATGCSTEEIIFEDDSDSKVTGKAITNWLWDFGDPSSRALNTSNLQTPLHVYSTPGIYDVKLSVSAENGCFSEVITKQITINAKPEVVFNTVPTFCVGGNLVITNDSKISTGSIVSYSWDFGDGNLPITTTTPDPPVFSYTTPGVKTIKLTAFSDKGCANESTKTINIVPLPTVDFDLPGYCTYDGLAKFTNLTKDYDGTITNLRFEWDFGDTGSTTNETTSINGEHKYDTPGIYTITLKAYNQFGCLAATKTKQFTVNPIVEEANFIIQNENNLCSGKDVIINNTSKIAAPGKILKIEIYKDIINKPGEFFTINDPTAEDIILTYDKFGGLENRKFTIKLIAYSGATCFEIKEKEITIEPSPILKFDNIPDICLNDGFFKITTASETSGITGVGTYSGRGIVNPDGQFDPKIVGLGTFAITYTFKSDIAGLCEESIRQNITIKASPVVSAPPIVYVLAGGQVTLPASVVEGSNMSYNWTPVVNLSAANILNPIASPIEDTDYTLTATNGLGCETTTTIKVKVLEAVTVPNSFSPNGDNINDVWNIKYLNTYPNVTVSVFNRNGLVVFSSKGYDNPFNGDYRNQPLPVGVYYYIIDPKNGRKRLTGSVTIIR